MVKELGSFMVIFMISLTGFTILGMMLFVELDEFADFFDTFFIVFTTSSGNWDYTIFGRLSKNYQYGYTWMGIIILVNVLIVITLVISIFQDTYSQYSK
mmetsp:Transcript_7215/g.5193  ORF Transcript_7215/g.5193 Transcript_7215/m.5193 type:complete len:99 (+) Transcript_7215:3103-3399(+)